MNEFRPLGNTTFPPVVKNLLIINGIMFLATIVFQSSMQIELTEYLGLYYFQSDKFKIWQFVTHLFMHGGIGHIFSNMLALWMFGAVLENYWGSKRFFQYYILTGLGAALLHTFVNYVEINPLQQAIETYSANPTLPNFQSFISDHVPDVYKQDFFSVADAWQQAPQSLQGRKESVGIANELLKIKMDIPTVGASGAVFGLLLAFGMLFPNAMIYLYFFFPLKAKYFVILYGLFELYSGFANNPNDNVAHFAHLGGMLIGFILLKIWRIKRSDNYFG